MLTLFRCATLEDWTDVMYINIYGCHRYGGGIYAYDKVTEEEITEGAPADGRHTRRRREEERTGEGDDDDASRRQQISPRHEDRFVAVLARRPSRQHPHASVRATGLAAPSRRSPACQRCRWPTRDWRGDAPRGARTTLLSSRRVHNTSILAARARQHICQSTQRGWSYATFSKPDDWPGLFGNDYDIYIPRRWKCIPRRARAFFFVSLFPVPVWRETQYDSGDSTRSKYRAPLVSIDVCVRSCVCSLSFCVYVCVCVCAIALRVL